MGCSKSSCCPEEGQLARAIICQPADVLEDATTAIERLQSIPGSVEIAELRKEDISLYSRASDCMLNAGSVWLTGIERKHWFAVIIALKTGQRFILEYGFKGIHIKTLREFEGVRESESLYECKPRGVRKTGAELAAYLKDWKLTFNPTTHNCQSFVRFLCEFM